MREAKKKRLREAWHGPLTAEAIARAAAIGEKMLRRFWAQERDAGRLPQGPRPHFVERSKRTGRPVEIGAEIEIAAIDDGTPIAEPNRICKLECAAALDALRAHHPEHDSASAQTAPVPWLAFDRRGMPQPTHAMLMRMCREHDQRVRA